MGIQRLHLVTLLVAILMMGALSISGAFQAFRKEEEQRSRELTTNIYRNMQHNVEGLVREVDAYLTMHDEIPEDQKLSRFFRSSYIHHVQRDQRQNAMFWPIEDDEVVVSRNHAVMGRTYAASIVITPGSYQPMLRIEPLYSGENDVRALYFGARALMDIELVQDAAAIAFNTTSNKFVGIYPMVLSTRNGTSMVRMVDMARHRYEVSGQSDGLLKIDDLYFSEFLLGGSSGLLIGRESSPWYDFSWLPSAGWWWWLTFTSLILLIGVSSVAVYRLIYWPIRLATYVLDGKWDQRTSHHLQVSSTNRMLPFEIRLLLRHIKHIAFTRHQEYKGTLMHSDVDCLHLEAFEDEIQQLMVARDQPGTGSLLAFYSGEIADMRQQYRREDYRDVLSEVAERIRRHIQRTSDKDMASNDDVIMGYLGNGEFLLWVVGDFDVYKMAQSLHDTVMRHTYRFGRLSSRHSAVAVYPGVSGNLSPVKMMETLMFMLRSIRRKSAFQENVIIADKTWRSLALQEHVLVHMAKRGFTDQDIKVRYTPMVENATGETQCLVSAVYIADADLGEFPAGEDMDGLWEHHDLESSLVGEVLSSMERHIALLDKAGFSRVRLVLQASEKQAYSCFWREAVCAYAGNLLKQRLIIEMQGNPADARHVEGSKALSEEGFSLAYRQGIGSIGVQFAVDPVYVVYRPNDFSGRASDYHQAQAAARSKGLRLVNDMTQASNIFSVSLFYHPKDWSLIQSRSDLGISEALAFLQDDISSSMIMPSGHGNHDDDNDENVVPIKFGRP